MPSQGPTPHPDPKRHLSPRGAAAASCAKRNWQVCACHFGVGWCSGSPGLWTSREGVEVGGEPAAEIAELAQARVAGCEEAGVDGASDAWRDGHGGDDVEPGDVGDVTLVESPARLGHQDEPIEAVLDCEQGPECEIARAPQDAQAALSARPRTD